jgi:FKBP-type peptidyl-prolyl cis-trans isomerase
MKQFATALLAFFTVIALFSCDDNSLEKQRNNELELLNAYLLEHYPDLEPTSSGLYYCEETAGIGDTIKLGDRVQVFYATWLIDSFLIDESNGYTNGFRYEPLEFVVGAGSVVAGLDEAVTYMQKGTVANLVLDSGLAYGQNGSGTVPGFTSLLMQVEVYKVYPAN